MPRKPQPDIDFILKVDREMTESEYEDFMRILMDMFIKDYEKNEQDYNPK